MKERKKVLKNKDNLKFWGQFVRVYKDILVYEDDLCLQTSTSTDRTNFVANVINITQINFYLVFWVVLFWGQIVNSILLPCLDKWVNHTQEPGGGGGGGIHVYLQYRYMYVPLWRPPLSKPDFHSLDTHIFQ